MRFPPHCLRLSVALVVAALAIASLPNSAFAQFGDGGRDGGRGGFRGRGGFGGGFERGGGGMLGTLRDDAVQQELGLTDEQKEKIEELSESARPSREFFAQFAELRNLPDEERDAKMAEIRQQMEDRRREAEDKLKGVLQDEQYSRLQQLTLRNAGARGLLQDEVAEELKLSDEQKTQIREILESREGFGDFRSMTPEDFQRIREEREAKALAVLTDEQTQQWEQKLGSAPAVESTAETERSREDRGRRSGSSRRGSSGDATGSTVILPNGSQDSRDPVSSFSGERNAETGSAAPEETKKLSFNFRHAPWADVLRLFAEAAGLTIDLHDVPPGTFSYYDPNEYTPTEALDIINGYLLPKGYILVRRNNFLVSVNVDEGVPPNLVPTVNVSELEERGRNELLGVILPLQPGLDPATISKEVEGLLGPQGKVIPLASSNSLMIQDIGSNLRQVVTLLSDIAVPQSDDTLVFRRIPLQHMVATEAERQIRKLFGLEGATRNVSRAAESSGGGRSSIWDRFRRGRGNDDDDDRRNSLAQMMQAVTPDIHVSSDPRTNSVLVKAKAADMKLIEEMLEAIDVPEDEDAKRIAGNNTPVLRVYTLGEAEADEVAKTLDAIMPGVVVNEDGRNDMVHVMATPLEHEEIEVLVQRLDGAGGQTVDVIKLTRTDPVVMSQILTSLFSNVDRDIAPSIQADPMTRSLIVRASIDQVGQIRKMLLAYGEDGRGVAATGQGRFRTVPVAGRDPERIARMVEGILSESDGFSNEIRIVVPSDRGPVENLRTPSNTRRELPRERPERPTRSAERDAGADLRTQRTGRPQMYMASLTDEPAEDDEPAAQNAESQQVAAAPTGEPPAAEDAPKGDERGRSSDSPRVNIEVRDGDLFLYSADEKALNEVEGLIGELSQQMPVQNEWTVFYLQIADVNEAATLLQQLVPSSSVVSSSDSSYSGWGYSSRYSSRYSTPAIQSLKIIPDERTQSMFVSGPADKVREVEQFLRIIDAAETPESLRDRIPRTIPVEHADVLQVAQMVRDIYKDYMEDPNARGGDRDRGSFSFGRSSSNSSSSRRPNVRLTLAVDTRSSELIVSCDDPLFREIEDLVIERDRAAFEAEPSVQVVELNPASSALVQQALTSLSPKILVSTAGSPRTTTNQTDQNTNRSSNDSGDRSSNRGDDGGDSFRRMMEMRMMMDRSRGDSGRGRSDSGRGGSSDWRSRFGGGSSRWGRGRD